MPTENAQNSTLMSKGGTRAADRDAEEQHHSNIKQPSGFACHLVRKKDGSLHFGVDYQKLNEVTRKDAYALPRIDDMLNTLAGLQWFTTLDLISGYWEVQVEKSDKEKTAFCMTEGLYEFNVMPFGLCNAPATFQ